MAADAADDRGVEGQGGGAGRRPRLPVVSSKEEEAALLEADCHLMPEFWREKYEREARRNWDKFYLKHKDAFFKDRHYLHREFPELAPPAKECARGEGEAKSGEDEGIVLCVDVGCGAGNTVFPLLEVNPSLFFFALDFSPRAVAMVNEAAAAAGAGKPRARAFVCDFATEDIPAEVPRGQIRFLTLVFVLSAVHPCKMVNALRRLVPLLRPGDGTLLFRDYAAGDFAQIRFASERGRKLGENMYARGDGTQAFFFTEAEASRVFAEAGFAQLDLRVLEDARENRRTGEKWVRRFMQGRFRRAAGD